MSTSRRALAVSLIAAAAAVTSILAQTDEQTKELMEKDRRYFQRQTGAEEKAPEPAQSAPEQGPDPVVEQFLAEADKLIRDRNYDMRRSEHYRVQTDDPRMIAGAGTVLLESFRGFFEEFWRGRAELRPYEETSRIFLFYSYFKYNQLLTGKPRFDEFRSSGHYRPYFNVVVIHSDSLGGPEALPDTLVHEAAHQLIARRLYGPQGVEAHWVAEGLASYFGFTARSREGEFQPGAIGGKGIVLLRGEKRPAEGTGGRRLADLRGVVKRTPPSVHELLSIQDPAEYYGEGLQERYLLSWMLVHYLLHGEEAALADGFLRYLQADVAGDPGPEVLYEATGRGAEELSRGLRAHILGVKQRPRKKS